MRHLVLLTAILMLAGGAIAQTSQPGDLEKAIAALPDNTWMKLSPAREPAGRNYCAPCPGDGKLFYFGGDRMSNEFNDVELYDIKANTWTQSWEPDLKPDAEPGSKEKELDAKRVFDAGTGRLWPMRTFQQVCYLPERRSFLYSGHVGTWIYDPAAKKWSNPNGPHSPGAKFAPHTVLAWQSYHTFYSPQLKAPVCIVTARPFGVYVYDADKAEWKQRKADIPPTMQWYELYSTWVSTLNAHLISQRGKPFMWLYDAAEEKFTAIKDVPEVLQGTQALAYDSAADTIIALEQYKLDPENPSSKAGVEVWAMSPKALAWKKLDRDKEKASPTGYATGSWAPLVYDASRSVFIFLNRPTPTTCETWAYHYKAAGK
ncbi:MAG: kelch repeat-containing protein [Phycisphaerae bacterium]|nr:kelch repeat-containing protein [Phycisphaerae bacterium]